jgi:membrane-bound serine protease (ClpP class)
MKRHLKRYAILSISLILMGVGALGLAKNANVTVNDSNTALMLQVKGPIGPATQDYIKQGLEKAADTHAKAVILKLNTPGGLVTTTRDIIEDIISSPVPVITYVAPGGAHAASAGTYILYASHIAAMAPGTNMGAATPVAMSPTAQPADTTDKDKKKPLTNKNTEMQKAENDAAAYLQSLAELRGRNVPWTQKAVKESASISAQTALKEKVIDFVAANTQELLQKANGKEVEVLGKKIMLETKNLIVVQEKPDWRSQFLMTITNPNIAYLLLLAGMYGLFFEFMNPGFGVPGVLGAISILLALYAFQLLPVNYAALALILLGIAFFISEAAFPSGILGAGGVVSFIFGSIMLFDKDIPGFDIALSLILGVAVATSAFFILVAHTFIKSRHKPIVSGEEQLPNSIGKITKVEKNVNWMRLRGEMWQVKCETPLKKGQKVVVIHRAGLILWVTPAEN